MRRVIFTPLHNVMPIWSCLGGLEGAPDCHSLSGGDYQFLKEGCQLKARDRLLELIKGKALKFGTFRLASGKLSYYYCDGKMVTQDPEGLYLIAHLILPEIERLGIDAIGGVEVGAIPIASVVSYLSYTKGRPVRAFFVRKTRKEHGTQKVIEGALKSSDRVLVIDDVVTTGDSILQAIKAVEEKGCQILKVIVLVDRLEGAKEKLARRGYNFEAIFTRRDLGVTDEYLARVKAESSEGTSRQ